MTLPSGTVTFLFLDIEGSTGLLERIGADYPQLLFTYREITERAIDRHGGGTSAAKGTDCSLRSARLVGRSRARSSARAISVLLDGVSWLAFAENDQVRAMTALGAANAARSRVGLVRWALIAGLLDAAGVAAEAEHPALPDARRAGAEMSPQDAIAYALQPHHELAVTG